MNIPVAWADEGSPTHLASASMLGFNQPNLHRMLVYLFLEIASPQ